MIWDRATAQPVTDAYKHGPWSIRAPSSHGCDLWISPNSAMVLVVERPYDPNPEPGGEWESSQTERADGGKHGDLG